MRPTPLNDAELDAYDHIPRMLASRVSVWNVPAVPGRFSGITLGRHVIVDGPVERDGTSTLLAHELVHVRQWAELGAVGFLARYLAAFVGGLRTHRRWMPAYRSIPAEIEARELAASWRRRVVEARGRTAPERPDHL